jgi:hypothetical protein
MWSDIEFWRSSDSAVHLKLEGEISCRRKQGISGQAANFWSYLRSRFWILQLNDKEISDSITAKNLRHVGKA